MNKKHTYIYIFIILLLFLPMFFSSPFDNDMWFLINTGEYIVENGIPTVEPFTIHENLTFYAQQWLFSIILYSVYNLFGLTGVFIFTKALSMLFAWLLYKLYMFSSENNSVVSIITLFYSFFILGTVYLVARPQLFSLTFFLIELLLLEKFFKSQNVKYLMPIPFLSLSLINIHGSMWLMLFVLMAPYLVELFSFDLIKDKNGKSKLTFLYKTKLPFVLIMIVSLLVGFLNPYGFKMMTYLFRSYGIDTINNLVFEMQPSSFSSTIGTISLITIIGVFIIAFTNRHNKLNIRYFLLLFGTAFLALTALRSFPLFILGTFFIITYKCKDIFKSQSLVNLFIKLKKPLIVFLSILLILLNVIAIIDYCTNYDFKFKGASDYIKNNYSPKNAILYTYYDDGGYLQFLGYRTYLDPRAEVFIKANNEKEDILDEFLEVQTGKIYAGDFIEKYNFTHLILVEKADHTLRTYLTNTNLNNRYVCEYEDEYRSVWVRKDISIQTAA